MMRSIALRLRTAPRRFPERLARFSTAMKTTSTDPLSLKVFEDLRDMKDAGTFKTERVIISPQRAKISVENRKEEVINMCANNYLGLSSDPELIEAAKEAMDTHGLGLSSVRFICGTQDIHKELEEKISNFHQTEDTILYPSCFDANAGFFETVLTKEDAIISDALNHASIIDGVRLCKAARFRFDHMCMKSLEENLIAAKDARIKMIATDGVFSMDGDIAPLDEICALAEKHGAYVFVDECHATGFIGPTGRGTPELKGVMDKVLVITSTLGKALGGATGGYTTGPAQLISLLRNKSRPYLFSNTLAPCVVGASLVVFDRLSKYLHTHTIASKCNKQNIRLFGKQYIIYNTYKHKYMEKTKCACVLLRIYTFMENHNKKTLLRDTSLRDKLEANTTYFREAMSG
uniref:Aminotransferase class I/classII large domain-containing protein n=1 Tax=Lotharella globosa TaxID=91324 RepID=A0A7S3YV63_9EUKA